MENVVYCLYVAKRRLKEGLHHHQTIRMVLIEWSVRKMWEERMNSLNFASLTHLWRDHHWVDQHERIVSITCAKGLTTTPWREVEKVMRGLRMSGGERGVGRGVNTTTILHTVGSHNHPLPYALALCARGREGLDAVVISISFSPTNRTGLCGLKS
jgi:hypothetical protein